MATILVFAFEKGIVSKVILNFPIFKRLGAISYSVYMNHFLIIVAVDIVTKKFSKQSQWIDSGIVLGLAFIVYIVSSWTYKNIEMRFSRGMQVNSSKRVLNYSNRS
jgi:peptidoglycan/LPS O-acetylase OafA/YrhL